MSTALRIASVFGLVLALAAPARSEGVVVVGGPSAVQYADIQSAIAAAADGDVLVVADGSYPGFTISNKSLSIYAQPGATVVLTEPVQVDHLASKGRIVLSGLTMGMPRSIYLYPLISDQLRIIDCAGQVRVQGCAMYGVNLVHSADALTVVNSPHVVLSQCTVQGSSGLDDYNPFQFGGPGGRGLVATNSGIALYDCVVIGGRGGEADWAGDAGAGVFAGAGATVFTSRTMITGGKGGENYGLGSDGDGGAGARIEAGATLWTLDSVFTAGAAGGPTGHPGQAISSSGSVNHYPGIARTIASAALIGDASGSVSFTATGLPGDRVFLTSSLGVGWSLDLSYPGYWLVPLPPKMSTVPVGTIGSSGVLNFTVPVADLGSAASSLLLTRQCLVMDSQGKRWLTGPVEQLVYAHHGAPDCDGDGIVDFAACLDGAVSDCNHTLIPDACELASGAVSDCNHNGVPDSCDIASGTSADGNANGVPDDCEFPVPVYVDASAPAGGDGSQAAPFQDIQDGVDLAVSGMTVLVRDGTYTGNGNRNIDFHAKNIVVRSEHGPAGCIIDCQHLGRAFILYSHPNISSRIEGFTITHGLTAPNDSLGGTGGAIALDSASLTLVHCDFLDNETVTPSGGGGAIAAWLSNLVIEDCSFTSNITYGGTYGGNGGAILAVEQTDGDTTFTLRDCTFIGNKSKHGGAVAVGAMTVDVSRCTFIENGIPAQYADCVLGGAMLCYGMIVNVNDCLFAGNRASDSGGALSTFGGSNIRNSDFVGNTCWGPNSLGGAIEFGSGLFPRVLANCILWGNSASSGPEIAIAGDLTSIAYCDIDGGQAAVSADAFASVHWGAGLLALDPQFVDPDGADNDPLTFLDNVYRLRPTSLCIDAGDNFALPPDLLDVDGDGNTTEALPLDLNFKPRRADIVGAPDVGNGTAPLVDLGAYERQF